MAYTRQTVLVDMDEVLCDLVSEWLSVYERFGGERLTRDQIADYSMTTQVLYPDLLFKAIDKGPGMRNAKPLPGALEGLYRIYHAHDTYIVTYARHESWGRAHEAKLAWLWEYAPWFDRDRVVFTRAKHLVHADVLVEDNPGTLCRWMGHCPEGRGYLVSQPWNIGVVGPWARVSGLSEVADILCDGQAEAA